MDHGVLAIAAFAWVATHLGVSGTGVRGWLVRQVGEPAYLGLYSLLAVAMLAFLVLAWQATPHDRWLFTPGAAGLRAPYLLMPLAFMLLAGGLLVKNPTAVGQATGLDDPGVVRGVLTLTRHPVQWGILLWALSHVAANPDAASVLLFASLATVSFTGMLVMDRKGAARHGERWARFAAQTSLVPGVALLAGRARFAPRELLVPLAIGVALYFGARFGHFWLAGVALG